MEFDTWAGEGEVGAEGEKPCTGGRDSPDSAVEGAGQVAKLAEKLS